MELALPPPHTDIDALPYIDAQYNDPAVRKVVDRLIEEEKKAFKPQEDYLARWPLREPDFEAHPLLLGEWMRVCDEQPMPKLDNSRYQMEAPAKNRQTDLTAWQASVDNAQAQLEHQANRLCNLELLQKHGANAWRAHLNALEAANGSVSLAKDAVVAEIEAVNRKRKAEQTEVAPKLLKLESEWVSAVRKNIEIESQCLRLEQECVLLRERLAATT